MCAASNLRSFGILLFFVCSLNGYAQPTAPVAQDTLIQDFPERFSLYGITQRKVYQLNWNTPLGELSYEPNNSGYLGIGAHVLGLGLRFTLPVNGYFEKSRERYGETRFRDFDLFLFQKNWIVKGNYLQLDGFFQRRQEDEEEAGFDSLALINSNGRPLRPDMQLRAINLQATYFLDRKADRLSIIYNNHNRPLASSGSVSISGGINYLTAEADSILLNTLNRMSGINLTLQPGYFYTFVDGSLHAGLGMRLGPAMQYSWYTRSAARSTGFRVTPAFGLMLALGYDNGKRFVTLRSHLERTHWYSGQEYQLLVQKYTVELTAGFRFSETPWMARTRKSLPVQD